MESNVSELPLVTEAEKDALRLALSSASTAAEQSSGSGGSLTRSTGLEGATYLVQEMALQDKRQQLLCHQEDLEACNCEIQVLLKRQKGISEKIETLRNEVNLLVIEQGRARSVLLTSGGDSTLIGRSCFERCLAAVEVIAQFKLLIFLWNTSGKILIFLLLVPPVLPTRSLDKWLLW